MVFVGNKYYYDLLFEWLKKPLTTKTLDISCICFIIGRHGCGKTYGVNKAILDTGHNRAIFNGNCYKDFIDFIVKQTSSDILSQINGDFLSKKVIFIDEFETLVLYDRTFLNNIIDLLEKNKLPAVKIIIASAPLETKNAIKMSLSCYRLELSIPSEADIFLFLKENYSKVKNDKLLKISENCENNISVATIMASDLMINSMKKGNITNTHDKNILLNNIYNDNELDNIRIIIDQDRSLHPLRFHENLIKAIQQRKGTKIKKLELYKKFLLALCEWDMMTSNSKRLGIESDIGFEHIVRNVMSLYDLSDKKNKVELSTDFTKIFNYLSLKKKTLITLYNSETPWYNIGSIHKSIIENIEKKFST